MVGLYPDEGINYLVARECQRLMSRMWKLGLSPVLLVNPHVSPYTLTPQGPTYIHHLSVFYCLGHRVNPLRTARLSVHMVNGQGTWPPHVLL